MPVIITPAECTASALKAFRDLLLEGGEISIQPIKLEEHINDCLYLAFQYRDSELVGIAAIRQMKLERVKEKQHKTYKLDNIPDDDVPLLELGYSVTKSEYRGNGINSILNDMLLAKIKGRKIYATTGLQSMKRYLGKRGFEKKGIHHDGTKNLNLEYFEKRA